MPLSSYPSWRDGIWNAQRTGLSTKPHDDLPWQPRGDPGTHQQLLEYPMPYLTTEVHPRVARVTPGVGSESSPGWDQNHPRGGTLSCLIPFYTLMKRNTDLLWTTSARRHRSITFLWSFAAATTLIDVSASTLRRWLGSKRPLPCLPDLLRAGSALFQSHPVVPFWSITPP